MNNQRFDSSGVPREFWFNLKTGEVEFGKIVAAPFRVGPFETEAEARNALQTLSLRSKQWQEEDEKD